MPWISASSAKPSDKPKRKKAAPPVSREAALRKSLVAVLRKLGFVQRVVPSDDHLIKLAKQFTEYKAVKINREQQEIAMEFAEPNEEIDSTIPF